MAKPFSQIRLTTLFWMTAIVASYAAFLSQLSRENRLGVAVTLFAQAFFWLLAGVRQVRHWRESVGG